MSVRTSSTASVVYVSYDGLLEHLGSAQVVPHVEGLAGRGFSMTVLSFEKPEDMAAPERREAMEQRLSRAGCAWEPLRYHRKPTVPATAFDVAVAATRIRSLRPTLVHARSYVPAFMASLGTRNGDGKLLFDMRGFWIDERIEGQGWSPSSLRTQQGRRIESHLVARADHVVHLTDAARESVATGFPAGAADRHSTIPTCTDLERFRVPSDVAAVRRSLGLPTGGPVLLHAGTLGGRYQARRTMEVGRAFVQASGGSFLVVTKEVGEVEALAAEAGVPALVRTSEYHDMPSWVAAADAGLALISLGQSTVASAPTKVGEYLATGLAVTVTAVGDLPRHFDGAHFSRVVDDEEAPDVTAARLVDAARGVGRQGESRTLAERHYSLKAALDVYEAIYRRLGVEPCA